MQYLLMLFVAKWLKNNNNNNNMPAIFLSDWVS